jgi:site-specific DNA recombinase
MATTSGETLDVYARQSRLGDNRQRSTKGQVVDCRARVAERSATVGQVHIDSGRSAWNPRVKRPAWDALMARLEAGATDGVIVFDLARFSRRPIEGERLIAAAERGLIVLDSEGEYDLTTATGKRQFRDQMNSAAYESDLLSTRVKRGKKLKAMQGESNHSSRPFGFEDDGVTPREPEASVVRELTARVLAGESQDALIVELNARGVPTSYGKPWTRAGLRQVLTRPRNAGRVEYDGRTVARMATEPLIDPETFERLLALYASRRRGRPVSEAYLCSGIVCCGVCGHTLSGRPRSHLKPYSDGQVRRQYWCQPRATNGGCGRISIDQRDLDGHMAALVIEVLSDPRHAAAVESAARAAVDERHRLDAELADIEHTADELAGRLGRGEIDLHRFDAAVGPLDRRLAELRARRAEADNKTDAPPPGALAASKAQWAERWEVATVSERRALLRQALRGRRLVVMPADPKAARRFDPTRIVVQSQTASLS